MTNAKSAQQPWAPSRQQDIRLLTGTAQFIDDIDPPGTLHLAMVRSPLAHAIIKGIRTDEALRMPGVHAVLTGEELVRYAGAQPVVWEHIPNQQPVTARAMAVDRVRYVGRIVAAVAAETRALAEDAAELVEVDYEPLDVVSTVEQALAPGAPLLHPEWGTNVFGSQHYTTGDPAAAWDEAEVKVRGTLRVGRQFGAPLETRGCVATWDRHSDELELWISAQSPNRVREFIGQVFNKPLHSIRVRVPALGGGFGTKADFYGEEVITCLMAWLTGRPVKYIEDRLESFVASAHAREQILDMELGADRDGRIRCLRGRVTAALGGEIGSTGMGPAWLGAIMMPGPYKIPNISVEIRGVVTNRSPYGAYRGWGQPKGNFAMERMMDKLAVELGLDPAEIRRRNFVASDQFPHFNGMLPTYDSGRYAECLDLCLAEIEARGWRQQVAAARDGDVAKGIGLAFYVESTAAGPSRGMNALGLDQSGFDEEWVRMDSTGRVTVYTGHTDMGQGIETALADVVVAELGLRSRSDVTVTWGDTATCPYTGYGTGGSRAGALAGAAVKQAAGALRRKILQVAADLLEADPSDLVLADGRVTVRGNPTTGCTLAEVGFAAYRQVVRLKEGTDPTLEGRAVFDPPAQAYSYGCAAALVEVDRATGRVRVLQYLMSHDCGTVLNPMIVEGQLRGGSMQAIAGALYERIVYDDNGQILTTTFMDYAVPTALEIPPIDLVHMETPSPVIPGGMKGVGEAGVIPGGAAIASAVDDALGRERTFVTELPITAEHVFWMAESRH